MIDSPLAQAGLFLFIKALMLLLGLIYIIFTILVLSRVNLMTNTLVTKISPVLRIFALFYLILAIAAEVILFQILFLGQ
jgi:hypothetical protein